MIQLRVHMVMGHAAVSLWCLSHGPAHCLWSRSRWVETDDLLGLLDVLQDAARGVYVAQRHGDLEEATDECGL